MKQSINLKPRRMNRKIFLAAMAVTVFTACSDQVAETPSVVNSPQQETPGTPIMFGSESKGSTRAQFTGAEAADLLNKKFVVTGYKGSSTGSVGSIVFDNYLVEYAENTAYTTESNTRNWEYVGKGLIQPAINNGITSQSMKYWDYSKSQYDFIAWSTGSKEAIYDGTPSSGQVLVSGIDPSTATNPNKGAYTLTGKSADLMSCYIADIVTRAKSRYGDDPVTIKFRNLGAKVRMGIYETVPGYSVRNVEFYSAANTADVSTTPTLFTTNSTSLIYNSGTYTVYYPTVDDWSNSDNNQAHVKFSGTGSPSSTVGFGALNYFGSEESEKTSGDVFLGRSSNHASMAGEAEGNYFTQYLPNEAGIFLNLRVNYVLESTDGSGEIIEVKGATAQVPSFFTQWKAGFAYTYLFKISDRSNGYTGGYDPIGGGSTDDTPAGLYPITFDAVVVNSEDGDQAQETITLVSTPSITTYMEGQVVVNNNEYKVTGKPIYVTVGENNALVTLTTSNAALYTLDSNTYTEADILDALSFTSDESGNNITGRNGIALSGQTITPVSTIENGVDGNPINLGGNKAAKFSPAANTYAFVYIQKTPTTYEDLYAPVSKNPLEDVTGLYRNFSLTPASGEPQTGATYFSMDSDGKLTDVTSSVGTNVDGLYIYKSTPSERHKCMEGEKAVSGHGYFDKYTHNDGVYYTKIIKVVN